MRADRLLSLLMLLQTHGRMTAQKLATVLEVSERTIYRDVDALSAAGIPIYGDPGPEGGYALLDSYRTNLTGLTDGEIRALFMLSIPEPLAELGVSQALKTALLKLSAALPAARRHDEERVRQRFYLDSSWWFQDQEPVPYLQTVQEAVWQDRKLDLTYGIYPLGVEIEQVVAPYGLVAKAGVWYLVYSVGQAVRTQRLSTLRDVHILAEPFERPVNFDLAAFWREWCAERKQRQSHYIVTIRVAPNFLPELPRYFGDPIRAKIAQAGPPDAHGWISLDLSFESLEAARERLLGFGRAVEVVEPPALRRSILDFAAQIVALYTG